MPAHPLALELIQRLHASARILEIGSGSGRNTQALREAGFELVMLDDSAAASAGTISSVSGPFDAAISTHALLHGTLQSVRERVAAVTHLLVPYGFFCSTFGSTQDARFGIGEWVAENSFAPREGDERGIAHVFYDEALLRALLEPYFQIEVIEEHRVDDVAGRWAHPTSPLRGAFHWFVIARSG
jgi:hypothetical protein